MPLHDVGYRPWNETKTPSLTRWWIISETGFRLAFKSTWVKRLLFLAWIPVMYWGVAFFFLESSLSENGFIRGMAERSQQAEGFNGFGNSDDFERLRIELESKGVPRSETQKILNQIESPEIRQAFEQEGVNQIKRQIGKELRENFEWLPFPDELSEALESDDESATRHVVWSYLLMTLFRYPQALLILFLIGFVGPSLISRDIRSRAFLLYFSKPIGPLEYVIGKCVILTAFIVLVTTLPALSLYFFAVMLSPDLFVVASTWDIPFRIIASTFVLVIPISSLVLMLSSLTQETRFASFAWFAIWSLGHGAWMAIVIPQAVLLDRSPFSHVVLSSKVVQDWKLLSIYNNLGDVQDFIFGFSNLNEVVPGILTLIFITLFSLIVLFWRIKASIRA